MEIAPPEKGRETESYGVKNRRVGQRRPLVRPGAERSQVAMQGGRARWAKTPPQERRAWSDYMRAHQQRFWDGETLPRKPARQRAPVSIEASPVSVSLGVGARTERQPTFQAIPRIVIPQRERVDPLSEPWKLRPAIRYEI